MRVTCAGGVLLKGVTAWWGKACGRLKLKISRAGCYYRKKGHWEYWHFICWRNPFTGEWINRVCAERVIQFWGERLPILMTDGRLVDKSKTTASVIQKIVSIEKVIWKWELGLCKNVVFLKNFFQVQLIFLKIFKSYNIVNDASK